MASGAKTSGMPAKRSSRKLDASELEDVAHEVNAAAGSSTVAALVGDGTDQAALFDTIDRNHDGVISREEFEVAMKGKAATVTGGQARPDVAEPAAAASGGQTWSDIAEPTVITEDSLLMGSCDLSLLPKADDDSDQEEGHKPKPRAPESTRILDISQLPDDEEEAGEGSGDAVGGEGEAKEAPPPPPLPLAAPPAAAMPQADAPAKTVLTSGEITPFLTDSPAKTLAPQSTAPEKSKAIPAAAASPTVPQSSCEIAAAPASAGMGPFDGNDAAFAAKLHSKLAGEDDDDEGEEPAAPRAPQPTRMLDLSDLPPDSDEEENDNAVSLQAQGCIDSSFASKLHEKLAVENCNQEEEPDCCPRAPEPTKILAKDLLASLEVDYKHEDVKVRVNIDQIDDKLMAHMQKKLGSGDGGDEIDEPNVGGFKAPMNTVKLSKDMLANVGDKDDVVEDMDDDIGDRLPENPAAPLAAHKRGLRAPKPTMHFDDNLMKGVNLPAEDEEDDQQNKSQSLVGLGSALQSLATQQDMETACGETAATSAAGGSARPAPQPIPGVPDVAAPLAPPPSQPLNQNDPLAAQLQASLGALSGAERGGTRGEEDNNDASPTGPRAPVAPKNTQVFSGNLPDEDCEESYEQNTGFVQQLEGTLRALDKLQGFSNTAEGQQARQQLADSLKKLGASGDGYPGGSSASKQMSPRMPEPAPAAPPTPALAAPYAPPQASKAEPLQVAVEPDKPVLTAIQGSPVPEQLSVTPLPSPTDGQCTETPSSLSYSLSSLSKEELRTENDKLCQEIESLRMEIQRRRRELRINQKVIAGVA